MAKQSFVKLLSSIRTSAITKFVLFMGFTIVYFYFSYKSLPSRAVTRPTTGKNSNVTWRIIKRVQEPTLDLYAVEEEMASRRSVLYQACQDNPEANLRPNAWEFVIDAHHSLVWCNVFKAASTTWIYNFNLLGGYNAKHLAKNKQNLITLMRMKFPRPTISQLAIALQSSISFLIARDPLERVLSAYRNKIENVGNYYNKLAQTIIQRYRSPKDGIRTNSRPTFKEFVQHVLHSKPDEHWAPIYQFCTPCSVNFTVIAKIETLSTDQEYIINRARLEEILTPTLIRQQNRLQNRSRTKILLNRYYSQLNFKLLSQLIDMYRIDFELFGYNATKYFRFLN